MNDTPPSSQNEPPRPADFDKCGICGSEPAFDNLRDIVYCEKCGAHLVSKGWMKR